MSTITTTAELHRDRSTNDLRRSRFSRLRLPILAVALLWGLGVAAPASAADCPDADGDNFVVSDGSCTVPSGKTIGDCNDADASINPDASELCGTGIDENCDGMVDEGFEVMNLPEDGICDVPTGLCNDGHTTGCDDDSDCPSPRMCENAAFNRPMGCMTGDAGGCCQTFGIYECSADRLSLACELPEVDGVCRAFVDSEGIRRCNDGMTVCTSNAECPSLQLVPLEHEPEGSGGAADLTCFDGEDNNCDGLLDHQQLDCQGPEICNGFDDDNDGSIDEDFLLDGMALGDACTVGLGVCENTGIVICAADQASAECSENPGVAGLEGPPRSASCSDLLDNDCDGFVDLLDEASCTEAEICDGFDNDNDGSIDEDFPGLGGACSVGVGACQVAGVNVCSADGAGIVCGASDGAAGVEGPAGATCTDGIDNDCDGLFDDEDPSCGSASIGAICSLPLDQGKPSDCTGIHRVFFETFGHAPGASVQAELMAIDQDGTILGATEVQNGDRVELRSHSTFGGTSRNGRFVVFSSDRDRHHKIYAPVALLRVKVDDGVNRAEAYCSNVPYLAVTQPSGGVVSSSENNVTKVQATATLMDPESIVVKVDGVDVLGALGVDPTSCTPDTPCDGTAAIGAATVTVSDLVIQSAPAVGMASSNTVTMNLTNLGCGGHVVVIDGDKAPGSTLSPAPRHCTVDDLTDRAFSSTFAVTIDTPTPGLITNDIPTPVEGQVCHGMEIATLNINGLDVDVSGQVLTPGDGEDSADTYTLDFATALGQTNLFDDVRGLNNQLGTFDPGSNRLVAGAIDDEGNRTYSTLNFAVGSVASTAPALSSSSFAGFMEASSPAMASKDPFGDAMGDIRGLAADAVFAELTATGTRIPNALVLGLGEDAMDTFFAETCAKATEDAQQKIKDALESKVFPSKKINLLCDPRVTFDIPRGGVRFSGDLACHVETSNGDASEPDPHIKVIVSTPQMQIDVTARGNCCSGCSFICWHKVRVDMDSRFTIPANEVEFRITEAKFESPPDEDIQGQFRTFLEDPPFIVTRDNNDIGCIAGFFADLIDFLVNLFLTIFTFGTADDFSIFPDLSEIFDDDDFKQEIKVKDFTIKAREVKVNAQRFAEREKVLESEVDDVKIDNNGVTISFAATVNPLDADAEIQPTPGSLLTPASAPMPPIPEAPGANVFFVVADDLFNQIFGSMATQGDIKTQCLASSSTYDDLLRNNCDAILDSERSGVCHGHKRADCDSLPGLIGPNRAVKQGACHGIQGSSCESIDVSGFTLESVKEQKRQACRDNPSPNLFSEMPLLFCGRVDIPPKLLIEDNPATDNRVETHLRMQGVEIAVVVDRDVDMIDGELLTLPACTGSTITTGDCKLVATCLDLNFPTDLTLETDPRLRIRPIVGQRQIVPRESGVLCSGAVEFDSAAVDASDDSDPITDAMDDIDQLTPDVQSDGLDLGGVVVFDDPKMIAITTGNACTAPAENAGRSCTTNADCGSGGVCETMSRIPGFQDFLGIAGTLRAPDP